MKMSELGKRTQCDLDGLAQHLFFFRLGSLRPPELGGIMFGDSVIMSIAPRTTVGLQLLPNERLAVQVLRSATPTI